MFNKSWKWWHAQFFLGRHTFFHYLKKLWPWRKRHSLPEFRKNYVPEGAAAYFADLRKIAYFPGQCTTCGLCDAACPVLVDKSVPDFTGPMRLVVSAMRGGTLLEAAEPSLRLMASDQCSECRLCEISCPEKIPMQTLSQCFLAQLNEIRSPIL